MKKFAAILLTVFMVISLAACGREEESAKEVTSDAGTVETIPEGEQMDSGADC